MSRHLLLISLFFLALAETQAQDSLTVNQLVERILGRHPAIEQGLQNVRAAEARAMLSASASYPEVSTEASYTFLGPIAKLAFPGLGEFRLYPADNYDAHVGGRYTVYDFGKVDASVDLSRSRAQTMRDAVEMTRTTLTFQAIRVFYSILYLHESIKVQDEQIAALNEHLAMTKRRVSSGTATSFDVLTTEVRVASAQSQKIELVNMRQKQEAVIRQLLGLPAGAMVALRGTFAQQPFPINRDSLLETAMSHRPEVKLAGDAQQSAELQRKVASLGDRPSFKVNLAYGLKNGFIPNLDVLRGNWVANFDAQLPIFNGWRTDHQEEEAEAGILAEQAHRQDLEQQVRSEVEQAIADVNSAQEKITISELQIRQAQEAVSLAQARYETGTVTNLDLLDAQAAESTAKLGRVQAIYKLVMSRHELQRAIGANPLEE